MPGDAKPILRAVPKDHEQPVCSGCFYRKLWPCVKRSVTCCYAYSDEMPEVIFKEVKREPVR